MQIRSNHLTVPRSARVASAGHPESSRSVWYLLHGYGQLAPDFLGQCQALDRPGRLLVAPEGLSRFYTRGVSERPGASWMTREDREAEIRDQQAYLGAVHADVTGRMGGAPERTFVLGFSQGATTADRWVAGGAVDPDAVILWGGAPAMDLGAGTPTVRHLVMVHGTTDPFITPKAAAPIRDLLAARGQAIEIVRFEGGHVIDPATLSSLANRLDP